ncbi:MAG TPA: LysR family transcriptional regulator [Candidatus Limnocylindria bacterium]|nr:LysR family transcriptional regulator [Candidatus Limnocylindria bacterium]
MELRQLAYLEAVIDTGTFAAAAEREHVAQPALWLQVRALEREWGVPLFVRVGRRVRPTPAALALRHRIRVLTGDAEGLATEVRALREGDAGVVRIPTAPYPRLATFIAAAIAEYARRFPIAPLPVRVALGTTTTVYDALEQGQVDLATGVPPEGRSFVSAPLYEVAIVATGRRLSRGPIEVRDLAELPLAMLSPEFGSRRVLEETARTEHLVLRVAYEDVYPESIIELARHGTAVAVLASDALPLEHALPVAEVRHHGRSLSGTLSLLWRDEHTLSTSARRFRDVVIQLATTRRPLKLGGAGRATATSRRRRPPVDRVR